ncbi:hypothetical protein MUK70_11735 [Dyadobacter chenwenxiniae]|uniref:Uncharacterized protein n=1 Tax=Dyadobacter chenwenxiniae TaxID=2906456 RepID=A0A9X1PF07_9BACT|nr:hypothetical protein [Dyadobacter chenwenxiniae]MCF0059912.1 hypothetical protein [Dyadobacter chenwenxiniae]UON85651.1 hypothetical protein MUK70_11735 [Dyadobacter chenwenxiniae]
MEKLELYRTYKEDWDGYGGLPFSDKVIDNTKFVINSFHQQPHISPTGRGSVQLSYRLEEKCIEVEISDNLEVEVLEIIGVVEREYSEQIDQIANRIYDFFNSGSSIR